MRLIWDEQGIKWFLDASAYTGFHKSLAQKIIPHLEQGDTLCDAGCGLGRLDLELAPFVSNLTAVDINENAIEVLRRDAGRFGFCNLQADVCDASSLTGLFDIVLMSFFGQLDTLDFLKLCRRKLIRIVSSNNNSNFYPERYKCDAKETVPKVCDGLDALGVIYKLEYCSIEFGQPLLSMQDAEMYILRNAPGASAEEALEFLDEHIIHTGRDDFPLFLPNLKELGIFVIDRSSSK